MNRSNTGPWPTDPAREAAFARRLERLAWLMDRAFFDPGGPGSASGSTPCWAFCRWAATS